MRFHVLTLPHTVTSKEFVPCAYTMKVLNFCRMMTSLGHEVFHYGTEGSQVDAEHVTVITQDEQRRLVKGRDEWKTKFFDIGWSPDLPYWQMVNFRAAQEIKRRKQPGDFLCVIAGTCQKPVADQVPDLRCVEFGIGYDGTFAKYRVFESYAWMHAVLAAQPPGLKKANGRFYDAVIPNYYDENDFTLGDGGGGYLLFIGRLIERKGIMTAVQAAQAAGIPLKVAGQGGEMRDGRLYYDGGQSVDATGVEYLGTVDVAQRNALMGGAIATLVPTYYIGPFEGVHVESQMCGTPVITTDWGVFTETVRNSFNGWRCHTLGEFVQAIREAPMVDRARIRDHAILHWSLDMVALRYDQYFRRLADLDGKGWYTLPG